MEMDDDNVFRFSKLDVFMPVMLIQHTTQVLSYKTWGTKERNMIYSDTNAMILSAPYGLYFQF